MSEEALASDADESMERFEVPDIEDLPDDVRERIEKETERAGFTPGAFLNYAYKPNHFRAFFSFYDALCDESPLSRPEIEMIIVTISGVNDCLGCTIAHSALLRVYGDDPKLPDQLAVNHRSADLSERHRAMLDVAVKLTEEPGRIGDDEVERLREAGFTDDEIWDIGMVTGLFNLSNRMSSLAGMKPNDVYYDMAR